MILLAATVAFAPPLFLIGWTFLRVGSKPVPPTPAEKALMAYMVETERSGCSTGCSHPIHGASAKPWPSRPAKKNLSSSHPYGWLFNQQIDLILQRERVETL